MRVIKKFKSEYTIALCPCSPSFHTLAHFGLPEGNESGIFPHVIDAKCYIGGLALFLDSPSSMSAHIMTFDFVEIVDEEPGRF